MGRPPDLAQIVSAGHPGHLNKEQGTWLSSGDLVRHHGPGCHDWGGAGTGVLAPDNRTRS